MATFKDARVQLSEEESCREVAWSFNCVRSSQNSKVRFLLMVLYLLIAPQYSSTTEFLFTLGIDKQYLLMSAPLSFHGIFKCHQSRGNFSTLQLLKLEINLKLFCD